MQWVTPFYKYVVDSMGLDIWFRVCFSWCQTACVLTFSSLWLCLFISGSTIVFLFVNLCTMKDRNLLMKKIFYCYKNMLSGFKIMYFFHTIISIVFCNNILDRMQWLFSHFINWEDASDQLSCLSVTHLPHSILTLYADACLCVLPLVTSLKQYFIRARYQIQGHTTARKSIYH